MSGVVSVRPAVALLAALFTMVGLAGPAEAAKPARASVSITAPADGSTGPGANVVVSGTAKGVTAVVVTVTDDLNRYEVAVSRGDWSTMVNPMPAGTNQICAEGFSSGVSVARSCTTYRVEPTGEALSLDPQDGAVVQSSFLASGGCDGNALLRLTLDGSALSLPCTYYYYEHRYDDVPEGEHTLTVEELALDGTTVVASVTHTFTSLPTAVATVEITAPADGSSGDSTTVTVSGTESSNVDTLVRVYLDGVFTDAVHGTDGQWSSTIVADWGTHEICAEKSDTRGTPIARDCITHTVALSESSLSITSPAEGSAQQTFVTAAGTCVADLVLSLSVDAGEPEQFRCFDGAWARNVFLGDGPHTLTLSMSAGGTTVTASVRFTVDAEPPAPVTVLSPAAGSTISSVPVTLSGTAEAGTTVTVFGTDGEPYRSATTSAAGAWSTTLERDFFEAAGVLTGRPGAVTFSIGVADPAGNQGEMVTVTYTTRLR